jgi:streptogramin lyase
MKLQQTVAVPMIAMQTICAALLCAACGGTNNSSAAPPLKSITLPTGAALKPFVSADLGISKPEGMALTADGRAWVVLTNLDSAYNVAGPAFLAGVVPSTGVITLVDLAAGANPDGGTSDDHNCLNAGVVKLDNGNLIAACTGGFAADTRGRAVVEVDPEHGTLLHTLPAPSGFQPASVAVGGATKIWVSDTDSLKLISIDRSTFALVDGADASHPAISLPCMDSADTYLYTSDILVDGSDLFALCAGTPDGYIVQLNASTGAVVGTPQLVGGTPTAMAVLGDGRIAVVNSTDSTLALVTRGSGASPTVQRAVYTFANGSGLQDVKARGQFVYATSSLTNTVEKLDLTKTTAATMLVGEVSLGANAYPWSIVPLDDDQAEVSDNGTGALVGVNFSTGTSDAGTAGTTLP